MRAASFHSLVLLGVTHPHIQVLTGHHFPEQVTVNEHPSRVLSPVPTETESANMGPL